jgi:hypothetical protein
MTRQGSAASAGSLLPASSPSLQAARLAMGYLSMMRSPPMSAMISSLPPSAPT